MTIPLVFNDLCLQTTAPDKSTAQQWMADFVRTLMAANDAKLEVFRTTSHFEEMLLAPNYPMQAWFNDGIVSRESRDYVLTYATRYPIINPPLADLPLDDEIVVRSQRFLCTFEAQDAVGLGYAFLLGGLATSLLTESCWDATSIMLEAMEEDPITGNIVTIPAAAKHAARFQHIAEHAPWIKEQLKNSVRDGRDLLQKTQQWYPNLIFCEKARKQLTAIRSGAVQLQRIVERLFELERFCSEWTSDGFDGARLHCHSGESEATLNNRDLRRHREIVCPDGETRLFELHLKCLPDVWRIHFWPDIASRRILVGYIGEHLPTVNDPT